MKRLLTLICLIMNVPALYAQAEFLHDPRGVHFSADYVSADHAFGYGGSASYLIKNTLVLGLGIGHAETKKDATIANISEGDVGYSKSTSLTWSPYITAYLINSEDGVFPVSAAFSAAYARTGYTSKDLDPAKLRSSSILYGLSFYRKLFLSTTTDLVPSYAVTRIRTTFRVKEPGSRYRSSKEEINATSYMVGLAWGTYVSGDSEFIVGIGLTRTDGESSYSVSVGYTIEME